MSSGMRWADSSDEEEEIVMPPPPQPTVSAGLNDGTIGATSAKVSKSTMHT